MNTVLRIPIIRDKIIESFESILLPLGYKIRRRKGENSFLKKTNYGYTEVQFFYYDYFPIMYEVHFVIRVYQNDIVNIISAFYETKSKPIYGTPNIGFSEGDFVESLRDALVKYRSGYKNKLKTEEDLFNVIGGYKRIIENEFLPMEKIFSSIEGTNHYLNMQKHILADNCDFEGIATSLITSQILNKKEYKLLYDYYITELLGKKDRYGAMLTNVINLVTDFNIYLEQLGELTAP